MAILLKRAFRGPFKGSERQKISMFPKSSEITIKTVLRPFFSEIYAFLVENFAKFHFIGKNANSLQLNQGLVPPIKC